MERINCYHTTEGECQNNAKSKLGIHYGIHIAGFLNLMNGCE